MSSQMVRCPVGSDKVRSMRLEVAGEQPVQLLLSLRAPLGLGSADTELDAASQVLGLDKVGVLISS